MKVSIEIDKDSDMVRILTSEGKEYLLKSLALFGGDAQHNELFIQMYGSSADAAWAYGQGFVRSQSPEGGRGLRNFYKQCVARICQLLDPFAFKNQVNAEELLDRIENERKTDLLN